MVIPYNKGRKYKLSEMVRRCVICGTFGFLITYRSNINNGEKISCIHVTKANILYEKQHGIQVGRRRLQAKYNMMNHAFYESISIKS